MRQVIIVISGVIILIGAVLINNYLSNSKKPQVKIKADHTPSVFVKIVKNLPINVTVNSTGNLLATNRVELYAEVQGTMLRGQKNFKPGVRFNRGENIVLVKSDDFRAGVRSQKSNLQNLITAVLPDLRLDFPDSYHAWSQYLKDFDVNAPTAELPVPKTEKEKLFITGRNIYTTYYNVQNAELILEKYNIRAPFNGVLTESLVDPGTIIRPGQKLGEFIDPTDFELEVSVSSTVAAKLKENKNVELRTTGGSVQSYSGKINRINRSIDPGTQMMNIYIGVRGEGLEEGMFMEAMIDAFSVPNAIEVDRSLLLEENSLYVVRDSSLAMQSVEVVYFTKDKAVVRGLEDNDLLISKIVPGAYAGMKVNTITDKNTGL